MAQCVKEDEMRCTQLIGLSEKATAFLAQNALHDEPCVTCGRGGGMRSKIYKNASAAGMFDDGPTLMEYDCKDGVVAREEVQCAPWSSGPCIFLSLECFRNEISVENFEWTDGQIETSL